MITKPKLIQNQDKNERFSEKVSNMNELLLQNKEENFYCFLKDDSQNYDEISDQYSTQKSQQTCQNSNDLSYQNFSLKKEFLIFSQLFLENQLNQDAVTQETQDLREQDNYFLKIESFENETQRNIPYKQLLQNDIHHHQSQQRNQKANKVKFNPIKCLSAQVKLNKHLCDEDSISDSDQSEEIQRKIEENQGNKNISLFEKLNSCFFTDNNIKIGWQAQKHDSHQNNLISQRAELNCIFQPLLKQEKKEQIFVFKSDVKQGDKEIQIENLSFSQNPEQNCSKDKQFQQPIGSQDTQPYIFQEFSSQTKIKKKYNKKSKLIEIQSLCENNTDNLVIEQNQNSQMILAETFICKFCGRNFSKRQQMGGHQSKAHPGQSDKYKQKQEIRNRREKDREIHQKSIVIFKEKHPNLQVKHNRNLLKKIRDQMESEQNQQQNNDQSD